MYRVSWRISLLAKLIALRDVTYQKQGSTLKNDTRSPEGACMYRVSWRISLLAKLIALRDVTCREISDTVEFC